MVYNNSITTSIKGFKVYTIVCDADNGRGLVRHWLNTKNQFFYATNRARKFNSVENARSWWMNNKYSVKSPQHILGSSHISFMVQGPRKGLYAIH